MARCAAQLVFGRFLNPAATEVCDGYDTDCDGSTIYVDDDLTPDLDVDGDGYVLCDGDAVGFVNHLNEGADFL